MVVLLLSLIAVCMLAAGAAILAMHLATLLGSVRGEHGALLEGRPVFLGELTRTAEEREGKDHVGIGAGFGWANRPNS
eukprot:1183042-Prorocentrum_minimum.AAC.5